MTANPHTGSDFDDFLKEENLYEDCSAIAIKRVLARKRSGGNENMVV
jgi:antitoxin HicB